MLHYEAGQAPIYFVFMLKGSVFPKALSWAVPSALLAYGCNWAQYTLLGAQWNWARDHNLHYISGGFSAVLGFLLVFRTQIAYSRFWEGATYLQSIRGGWFNVVSSCFAFCSVAPDKLVEVKKFQHQLVRLMSLLYCVALQEVAEMENCSFEVIDPKGLHLDSVSWMKMREEKCEVILQWIQRLIVEAHMSGVLSIAPPILSRVFQELAGGIIDVSHARRIKMISFPFPYAQMITIMLCLHWVCQHFCPACTCFNHGARLD